MPRRLVLASIERAVQKRLAECKLKGLREYWKLVSTSESERQELIEAVVVPETWFFRDREAFTGLVRIVQENCPASRAQSPLRLLSLPSSTGEEAYSIVMALLDAGLTAERFRVDGNRHQPACLGASRARGIWEKFFSRQ